MRAIILAGGKGTRLRPFTTLIPKPLVPLGGKYSILEIILLQLRDAGFKHVTIAVNHLSHLIMTYFGDGTKFGIKIDYSIEEKELSTIGPLTLIEDLPDNFIVMNGDILCNLDYKKFYDEHIASDSLITVSSFARNVDIDFGVLTFDNNNLLSSFVEKPSYKFMVSMGIYCINRQVVKNIERGSKYGFDNLMIDCLKSKTPARIAPFDGYWLDIGRPDDYEYADNNFSELIRKLGIVLL